MSEDAEKLHVWEKVTCKLLALKYFASLAIQLRNFCVLTQNPAEQYNLMAISSEWVLQQKATKKCIHTDWHKGFKTPTESLKIPSSLKRWGRQLKMCKSEQPYENSVTLLNFENEPWWLSSNYQMIIQTLKRKQFVQQWLHNHSHQTHGRDVIRAYSIQLSPSVSLPYQKRVSWNQSKRVQRMGSQFL